jgi:hypothetical protein
MSGLAHCGWERLSYLLERMDDHISFVRLVSQIMWNSDSGTGFTPPLQLLHHPGDSTPDITRSLVESKTGRKDLVIINKWCGEENGVTTANSFSDDIDRCENGSKAAVE